MKTKLTYPFSYNNPTKSITTQVYHFKLKMEISIPRSTLFIHIFLQSLEHCIFIMIPSKTILIHIQDNSTHPINQTRSETRAIKAIETSNIDSTLSIHCSCGILNTNCMQISNNLSIPNVPNQHTSQKRYIF